LDELNTAGQNTTRIFITQLKLNVMYLAINKNDPYEYHSFTWTQDDRLIINGNEVNTREWEIIWIEQMQPC